MTAPLSYKSQYGYYGLRVNPTYEQVVGTVRKPLRIPVPDRSAKWYALGPYRSLILDANEQAAGYDRRAIEYDLNAGKLPQYAAKVHPSQAGSDPTFDHIDQHHENMQQQQAYEVAHAAQEEGHRQETAAVRDQQLRAIHHPNNMNPTIEANHDELEEAGMPHDMPAPGLPPLRRGWPAPHEQMVSAGQPQAKEFTPFEVLNMGQPANVRKATLNISQNMTYERMREFVPEKTWPS